MEGENTTSCSQIASGECALQGDQLQISSDVERQDNEELTHDETKCPSDQKVIVDEQVGDNQDAPGATGHQEEKEAISRAKEQHETKQVNSAEADVSSVEGDSLKTSNSNVKAASATNTNIEDLNKLLTKSAIEEKKSTKDSTRNKRKEDKAIEHVLKALSSLETTEEKLAALCKKYTELLDEHRLLQNSHKQMQKKFNSLSREKDQLQSEQSKTVLAKSKLESLCRELQKHNKIIKDESVARAKEEEEKRKEVTAKFQATINDIQQQMNENYEKNNKLRGENMELANKLKNLIEQYELREQHIEKIFKHKELELQLVEAKLAQANVQRTEEQERHLKEKQQILEAACQSQKKIETQEQQLRTQVALYTGKYEEFQSTLAKSNEVFQSFKSEMDKMTKKIKKLEKETVMWKTRWENSNRKLLEMVEYKTRSDKETVVLNSKVQKLENLCRALQEERKKLAAQIPSEDIPINGVQNELAPGEPTKTPPNTPEGGTSRSSPVTVEETTVTPSANDMSGEAAVVSSHPEACSQMETQPEEVVLVHLDNTSEAASEVDSIAVNQSKVIAESETRKETELQMDSQLASVPQKESQSDAVLHSDSQSDAVLHSGSQSDAVPESDTQTNDQLESKCQIDNQEQQDNMQ